MVKVVLGQQGWLSGLCALLAFAGPACAGDSAQFNALGYSQDGRHFAFEQFGIQDGSGFPYADIFLIDLETDTFAGGSPFRTRIDSEMTHVAEARAQVLMQAEESLAEFGISRPALPLVLRGDGELVDEGLSIVYGIPSYGLDQTRGEYALSLDIFKAPSGQDCEFFEGGPMGFALYRETGEGREQLHRDTRVPASRNCVITYKFYGVFNPFESWDNSAAVAVLSVWSHGFEGPDRRFIALPVGER
ncbi:DUF2259 domain-containing protein [Pelagibacterium lentulum]|uniref:DUF2259 domain-containing protein n=1 Tax=Pelagibacterium lentulum TaxID=2029865 RepID=A0A916R5V5_9HYPH|nr:DUF2259 domain-containing protein [Pelagibacterium lentulum]GGA38016.1 hypothetical protein GCM10011499_04240 [Pelagibacterium lentulum]